ncbi:hypothetical protein HYN48_14155 [Flavobacterium magnum]|uniref:Uncharacterized protein n=1 Tax=Flavobacterium magnum TaxID=2162713 RepID=A0A2S0RHC0_9FLAO|nr:hypothetical protein [Flavobacterium magnum]AWA31143.1 hypothetical protein HYN48_14155 [Flavobacterium magnum]
MINKFSISLLLIFNYSFGQKTKIDRFVSDAAKAVIKPEFRYYNLIDSSFIAENNKIYLDRFEEAELSENYPDLHIGQLFEHDSVNALNWNDYNIPRAKVISPKEIPKYHLNSRIVVVRYSDTPKEELDRLEKDKPFGKIIVIIDKNWSEERKQREIDEKVDDFEKRFAEYQSTFAEEDKIYYSFSTPVFSDDNKYALMSIHVDSRKSSCCGCSYLFKFENESWQQIYIFRCIMR